MEGVGPDIKFKRIGFPSPKHPNLGVRRAFGGRLTSGANAKAVTVIPAGI